MASPPPDGSSDRTNPNEPKPKLILELAKTVAAMLELLKAARNSIQPPPENKNETVQAANTGSQTQGDGGSTGDEIRSQGDEGSNNNGINERASLHGDGGSVSNKGSETNEEQNFTCDRALMLPKKEKKETVKDDDDEGKENGSTRTYGKAHVDQEFDKLQNDLNHVYRSLTKLQKLGDNVGGDINNLYKILQSLQDSVKPDGNGVFTEKQIKKLTKLGKHVVNLKIKIPPLQDLSSIIGIRRDLGFKDLGAADGVDKMPDSEFVKFREDFKSLSTPDTKMCLLCFSLFPKNAMIKRRLLIDWWVGEEFIDSTGEQTAKELADKVLDELAGRGFIQPVNKMNGLPVDICKKYGVAMDFYMLHPLVRSAVIRLAQEEGFFVFDDHGIPTNKMSTFHKACLRENYKFPYDGKLQTLFNFNKRYPDFKLELELFSKMTELRVLYLGRCESVDKNHIEVESYEFLSALKYMKKLRFISVQGIFGLTKLPKYVCKLPHLRVLDLRACHNLEELPDEISSLKNLTHLDISECYLLDHMPRGLSLLTELRVFKGFVVGHKKKGKKSCSVEELAALQKLSKLSIYTSVKSFPMDKEINALRKLTRLRRLKIVWGGDTDEKGDEQTQAAEHDNRCSCSALIKPKNAGSGEGESTRGGNAFELEKLDLQCIPNKTPPLWLSPQSLLNLKRLYIRGGSLKNLGKMQEEADKWKEVRILRLKFLNDFELTWRDLQKSFPKLIYLEKVKCSRLTLYPCDAKGVWMSSTMQ